MQSIEKLSNYTRSHGQDKSVKHKNYYKAYRLDDIKIAKDLLMQAFEKVTHSIKGYNYGSDRFRRAWNLRDDFFDDYEGTRPIDDIGSPHNALDI